MIPQRVINGTSRNTSWPQAPVYSWGHDGSQRGERSLRYFSGDEATQGGLAVPHHSGHDVCGLRRCVGASETAIAFWPSFHAKGPLFHSLPAGCVRRRHPGILIPPRHAHPVCAYAGFGGGHYEGHSSRHTLGILYIVYVIIRT